MKRWIKHTVIALFSATALFGGLAAWAQHRGSSWGPMSAQDATEMKARIVEKVGRHLDLDAVQKTRLGVLADALRAQHLALVGNSADPRAEWQALIAGNTFDRTKATGSPPRRFRNMTKAMHSARGQGANRSNARRHCEDLQRGHRVEGALSCFEISVAGY